MLAATVHPLRQVSGDAASRDAHVVLSGLLCQDGYNARGHGHGGEPPGGQERYARPPRLPDSTRDHLRRSERHRLRFMASPRARVLKQAGKNQEKPRTTASMSPPPFPLRRGRGRICGRVVDSRGRTARPISAARCGNNGCGLRERGTDGDVESGVPRRVRRRDARRRDRPRFEPTPRCPGTGQRRHVRQRHRANRVRALRLVSSTRRLGTVQPAVVRGPQEAEQSGSRPSRRSRYMPPWKPEPGYGDFADARRLTDAADRADSAVGRGGRAEATPRRCRPRQRAAAQWHLGDAGSRPDDGPAYTASRRRRRRVSTLRHSDPGFPASASSRRGNCAPATPRVVHHATMEIDPDGYVATSRRCRIRHRATKV